MEAKAVWTRMGRRLGLSLLTASVFGVSACAAPPAPAPRGAQTAAQTSTLLSAGLFVAPHGTQRTILGIGQYYEAARVQNESVTPYPGEDTWQADSMNRVSSYRQGNKAWVHVQASDRPDSTLAEGADRS